MFKLLVNPYYGVANNQKLILVKEFVVTNQDLIYYFKIQFLHVSVSQLQYLRHRLVDNEQFSFRLCSKLNQ